MGLRRSCANSTSAACPDPGPAAARLAEQAHMQPVDQARLAAACGQQGPGSGRAPTQPGPPPRRRHQVVRGCGAVPWAGHRKARFCCGRAGRRDRHAQDFAERRGFTYTALSTGRNHGRAFGTGCVNVAVPLATRAAFFVTAWVFPANRAPGRDGGSTAGWNIASWRALTQRRYRAGWGSPRRSAGGSRRRS